MPDLSQEIAMMRADLAEMKSLLLQVVTPATSLSTREEADILRAAVAEGTPAAMRRATKRINGGKK